MICIPHPVFFSGDYIEKNEMDWGISTYGGRGEACTGFWLGNLREKALGRPRNEGEDNIKRIFRKWNAGVWTGSSWLWIGTGGGHL